MNIQATKDSAIDSARSFANRSMGAVGDAASQAQRQLGQYASATTRYVADQPLKSALIAAAVGAAVAGLIVASRRYYRNHY
jgi:ElaB/YqjD/DUF883 family membrane-anchored ribosome-binding protein